MQLLPGIYMARNEGETQRVIVALIGTFTQRDRLAAWCDQTLCTAADTRVPECPPSPGFPISLETVRPVPMTKISTVAPSLPSVAAISSASLKLKDVIPNVSPFLRMPYSGPAGAKPFRCIITFLLALRMSQGAAPQNDRIRESDQRYNSMAALITCCLPDALINVWLCRGFEIDRKFK
jgi:hypothetical protein